jgi:PAS domain S-box-containing protein
MANIGYREKPLQSIINVLSPTHKPLRGQRLALARAGWIVLAVLSLSLFILALPQRFTDLLQAGVDYAAALSILDLPITFYALYFLLPDVVTVIVFTLVAAVLFWQKSNDGMVLFVSMTVLLVGVIFPPTLDVLSDQPWLWRLVLFIQGLGAMMSLAFFFVFPDGAFVPAFSRIAVALIAVWTLSWGLFPNAWTTPPAEGGIGSELFLLGLYLIGLGAQFYRYFYISDDEHQQRTRWLVLGLTVTLIGWAFFSILGWLTPWVPSGLPRSIYGLIYHIASGYFPPLVLLLAMGISILRYRLWDIDLLINRGLVYSTLTTLLGGMYLLVVFILTIAVRAVFNTANNTLVVFGATLVIALSFNPLRKRIQALIDRAFYRTEADYQEVIQAMSTELASSIDLDRLSYLLCDALPEQLQINWAMLSIVKPENDCLAMVNQDESCYLPLNHPLITYLERTRYPIMTVKPPLDFPPSARAILEQHEVRLCLPLIVGDELIGLYQLGAKLSGGTYSRQEIQLLSMLGQQTAASVENARLYRRVQRYNLRLEEQVHARTQELETAYQNLEEEHAKLDVVLQNVADALVVTDLDGCITMVNPAFKKLACDSSALIGRQLREVFPDETLISAVRAARESAPLVITVDATWEQRIYRASACALTGESYLIEGVVTVLRDITREVEVAQMKDEFVSMVSHELRTPMTSVIGFSKLIQKQFHRNIQPALPEDDKRSQRASKRIADNLDIIVSEGDRLTRLINDVLDVAKMESGKLQWQIGEVDLCDVLESSIAAINSLARQKQLPVKIELAEQLPQLYGDHDRLVQVVTNLLSNAVKFTDAGCITVRARQLEAGREIAPCGRRFPKGICDGPLEQPMVAISVIDTGVGIAQEDTLYVFEKFHQVGNKQDGSRRPGTGLGLPICRQIVEFHGGKIWGESEPGKGARFIFTLPLDTPEQVIEEMAQGDRA